MVEKAEFTSNLYHPKYWLLWLGVLMMRITQVLPLAMQMKLGAALGRFAMTFAGSRTHTAKRNISLCFPDMPEDQQQALLKVKFTLLHLCH